MCSNAPLTEYRENILFESLRQKVVEKGFLCDDLGVCK